MFEPKLMLILGLIVGAAAFVSWFVGQLFSNFSRDKFTCAHCRRRVNNRDRDVWFADGICKTCGEYLIPINNRNQPNA